MQSNSSDISAFASEPGFKDFICGNEKGDLNRFNYETGEL
jgi:hypothetical protein